MMQTISKRDFEFIEISQEYKENFKAKDSHELTDLECWAMRLTGNALRGSKSQFFWSNGSYCWYTDDKQDHEQRVFITINGCLMFEDLNTGEMYRVRDIIR